MFLNIIDTLVWKTEHNITIHIVKNIEDLSGLYMQKVNAVNHPVITKKSVNSSHWEHAYEINERFIMYV